MWCCDDVGDRVNYRCQCTGQCGHNHQWLATQPAAQCRAPHACYVHRKRDNPSCWVLATQQGIDDRDRPVVSWRLAYSEPYDTKKTIRIELALVELGGVPLALCQRCKLLIERQGRPDDQSPDEPVRDASRAEQSETAAAG